MDSIKNSEEWRCPYPFITTDFLTNKEQEYIAQQLTNKTTDIYSEFEDYNFSNETEKDAVNSILEDIEENEENEEDDNDLFGDIDLDSESQFDDYFSQEELSEEDDLFGFFDEENNESIVEDNDYDIDIFEDEEIIDESDVLSIVGTTNVNRDTEEQEQSDIQEETNSEEISLDGIFEKDMSVSVVYGEEVLGEIKLELKYFKILNSFFTREWTLCINENTKEKVDADFIKLNMLRL